MSSSRAAGRRRRRTNRRVRLVVMVAVAVLVAAGIATFVWSRASERVAGDPAASASPSAPATSEPTLSPTPPTPAEALLATTSDPLACAVSFAVEGVEVAPVLQTEGALYAGLPVPRLEGRVFAGWYDSAAAVPAAGAEPAALPIAARVNGSELVACADHQRTLYGAWTTPEANAAVAAAIPILMYHQFTTRPEGEDGWLRLNYAYVGDFEAHMAHIADTGFYLPTWDELSAFIDGALYLPQHSVIITDDDADSTWLALAAPIVNDRKLLTTSFVITEARTEGTPNPFVLQRSHTHDMHEAGENGKGRMVNWTADQIAADLEQSAQILGVREVIAYPFGHYNDVAKQGVAQAGFGLARTIESGYVRIGTDKLALPTVRIDYGMSVDTLVRLIG